MFKNRIKEFLKIKNISNRDLAKKLEIDEGLLSRWLNSDKMSNSFLYRLIELFPDIDLNYLIKEPQPIEYSLEHASLHLGESQGMVESKSEIIRFHIERIELHTQKIKELMSQK